MPSVSSRHRRALLFWLWTLASVRGGPVVAGTPGPEPASVLQDRYFRESLAAIRDWEAILATAGKEEPKAESVPILPVPDNGEWVEWPNPIPARLLVGGDRELHLSLRVVAGGFEIRRLGADGSEPQSETLKPGQVAAGYHHPGGGAKDRWYHRYERRFDTLCSFRPVPAPFHLGVQAPLDLGRGPNRLDLSLRNLTAAPLPISLRLHKSTVGGTAVDSVRELVVPAQATAAVDLPVSLETEGGSILWLTLTAGGQTYRVPFLTHVEGVAAVLQSLADILAETPGTGALTALDSLRQRVADWTTGGTGAAARWRELFVEASAWREELLLRRVGFDTLLFVRRQPFDSEQPYMDAHHLHNRPGGSLCRLSPVRPDGAVTPVVDSLGEGIYRDLALHWDGARLLFSFGNGSDDWDGTHSYHIYEVGTDGTGLRQLTAGPKNDCEPFYLPCGQIGFTSDRPEHFVMCGGPRHVSNLHVMEADGSGVRQLSFNVFNEFNPTLLPDGRILYNRWEYNERSVTSLHHLFTMLADGTMVSPYYGNATIRPNITMFPRPIPDSPKVMCLFTGHHGQTHGPVGVIDRRRGVDGPAPVTLLTPNLPVVGEKAEDSRYGWYSDPLPLSDTTYLCSFTPTVVPWLPRSWALYVGDHHGNLALVYRDPEISCAEPVPLVRRRPPHTLPPAPADTAATNAEACLVVQNVYTGLPGVPAGAARFLRIVEDLPRQGVHPGGVVRTSGTPIYTIKRVLGSVPVETDGSAYFVVPANRNLYFEVLAGDSTEIQRMRSVVCLKPAEIRTCVGCHESRLASPPNRRASALRRPPSRPLPPPWGARVLSFLRDVQPLLNAHCSRCHTFDRAANQVLLTDDLTDRFTVAYEELLPYLTVANAMRWDHPDDVYPRPPYTYGSKVSPLSRLLAAGHQGVHLSEADWQRLVNWIDANGVYYDRYESAYGDERSIFGKAARTALSSPFERRCAGCHGKGDGQASTWWLSLNRRDVRRSRALMAPLARTAGGWGRCDGTVFASTADPDYQALLAAFTVVSEQLGVRPREDLLSIQGTDAERQDVTVPAPPPPRPANASSRLPEGWLPLGQLPWESAAAGWTPNRDGLPRQDTDIEGNALRLAARVYPHGIGTHAPSTITYQLRGGYDRFWAQVGAAESGGTVVFQVFGDDHCLFDSGLMRGLRGQKTADVAVAGVKALRLVVTDAGDGITADMANWVAPRLLPCPDSGQAPIPGRGP